MFYQSTTNPPLYKPIFCIMNCDQHRDCMANDAVLRVSNSVHSQLIPCIHQARERDILLVIIYIKYFK